MKRRTSGITSLEAAGSLYTMSIVTGDTRFELLTSYDLVCITGMRTPNEVTSNPPHQAHMHKYMSHRHIATQISFPSASIASLS